MKKASELLEEAIQRSETTTFDSASDEVKSFAQEKASALIGEAVRSADTPRLDQGSVDVKIIAEEKAGNVIEQAVKTVEVFLISSERRSPITATRSILVGARSCVMWSTMVCSLIGAANRPGLRANYSV